MLTTLKALLWSYLCLCLASFACLGSPAMQRLLVFGWAVMLVWISMRARRREVGFVVFIAAVCVVELPGICLSLVSGWCAVSGMPSEWPGGLMEFLYHPFVSLLELLPVVALGNWSAMYLSACLIPVGVVSFCAASWLMSPAFSVYLKRS